MESRLELFPDEPILIARLDNTFSIAQHITALIEEVTHILDTASEPLFYLVDVHEMKVGFEDLVAASNISAHGANTYLHHPNIRELIVIATDRLVAMGVKGLQSPVFGIGEISVFPTLEEALAYCRQHVSV